MQFLNAMLKRYAPKSLFGRALLILMVPILLLQVVIASVFVQRHYDALTVQMAGAMARELNFAIARIDEAATVEEARQAIAAMALQFDVEMGLDEGATLESRAIRC